MSDKKKKPFILSRFNPYMGKKKGLIPVSLILSAISAVLNVVPIVLIWYVVRILLAQPSGEVDFAAVSTYVWTIVGCVVGSVVVYFGALMCSHLAAFHVEVAMQKIGMEKIISHPLGFFDQHETGKIRKIVNDGAGTTHTFLAHQIPDIAGIVLTPLMILILIFIVKWQLGVATLIPVSFGIAIMMQMMSPKRVNFQKIYFDALEEMSSESVEYVRGIPVVKTFGQSIFSFKRFYNSVVNYRDMVTAYTLSWRMPMSFYQVILQSVPFLLIPVTLYLALRGESVGLMMADFIFYMLVFPIFSTFFMRLMYLSQNVMIAEQAIDRLDGLMGYASLPMASLPASMTDHSIEFNHISFAYEGSDQKALQDVSFKVKRGETVALVGPSGGGKTTIARLAARFWDADEGEVKIGGVDIKAIPQKDLMNEIAFVFQNTTLFKTTLRENILFGKENVSEAALNQAINASQSREIIDNLPQGLDTVIGSKGTYLSGGEQQRITLARAILKDAPIILLDEATAFADPENEELIQQALKEFRKEKTTLMIAHRLTSVADVDRILVIDGGKIVEQGDHDTLLQQNGLYKRMWDEYQNAIGWEISSKAAAQEGRN